jgi:hypothetical protein
VPVSGFTQALRNSERWKMTGKKDNVGFQAIESGVKQFPLSLGGRFISRRRCFIPRVMPPEKHQEKEPS